MAGQIVAVRMLSAALAIAASCIAAHAQTDAAADSNEARIEDLITASHILANEGILDSFGHATVRSATDPEPFLHAASHAACAGHPGGHRRAGPRLQAGHGERAAAERRALYPLRGLQGPRRCPVRRPYPRSGGDPLRPDRHAAAAGARAGRLPAERDSAVRGSGCLWAGGDRARHAGAQCRARKGVGDEARAATRSC